MGLNKLLNCFLFTVGIIILPSFGIPLLTFNSISIFDNFYSFRDRPYYVFDIKPEDHDDSNKAYVLSNEDCTIKHTKELVEFVNGISTKYLTLLFSISFGFYCLAYILGTLSRFGLFCCCDKLKISKEKLKHICKLASIFGTMSFVFSIPAMYSSKVNYGGCIKTNGLFQYFMNQASFIVMNIGMWSTFILQIYYLLIKKYELKFIPENKVFRTILALLCIFALFFLLIVLIIKFGSYWRLQIFWDIYLAVDIIFGFIILKLIDLILKNK